MLPAEYTPIIKVRFIYSDVVMLIVVVGECFNIVLKGSWEMRYKLFLLKTSFLFQLHTVLMNGVYSV